MSDVYETRAMKELTDVLNSNVSWSPDVMPCILVYGGLGVGKTFTVFEAGKRANYFVHYLAGEEAFSLDEIVNFSRSNSLTKKKLLLLDRPLLWIKISDLRKILKQSRIPVVIEVSSDELKYYKSLKCFEVRVDPPPKTWVVKKVKENKLVNKPKFGMITDDVRQALLIALGSEGYSKKEWLRSIEKYFKTCDTLGLEKSHLPVLLDTGVSNLYGLDFYRFLEKLVSFDLVGEKIRDLLKDTCPKKTVDISTRYYDLVREVLKT